jgi:hypothetical protein
MIALKGTDLPRICPDPVFVIGSPRSGTKILAWSLAGHRRLWTSVDEAGVLYRLFGPTRASDAFSEDMADPTGTFLQVENVDRDEFLAYLGLGMNALFTSRSQGNRWIEATPQGTFMADELLGLFPGGLFLHILRDGRRAVNSMINHLNFWEGSTRDWVASHTDWTTDFRAACMTWSQHVGAALAFSEHHPSRCLTVVHEDLMTDPEGGFRRIQDFLGLEYETGPAEIFQTQRINSSFPLATSKDRATRLWEPWKQWSGEQRRIFSETAGEMMARAGFEGPCIRSTGA